MKGDIMKRFRLVAIVLIVLMVFSAGAWWLIGSVSSKSATDILTSGFIEARDFAIAFESGGRIVELTVREGDRVNSGQTLVKLDDSLLQAQKQQAEAALGLAQANLELATVSQAGAKKAWDNALGVQRDPLELEAKIAAAEGELDMAELDLKRVRDIQSKWELAVAESRWDTARKVLDNLRFISALDLVSQRELNKLLFPAEGELNVADLNLAYLKQLQASWSLPAAQLRRDNAETALDSLLNIRDNPQTLNAAVDQAETAYKVATATLKAATKQVEQAQASLQLIRVQLEKLAASSPVTGVVASRNAEIGEIAKPGTPVLTVTDLSEVTLTAYVPEGKIGLVKLGQKTLVSVDSYPGESFTGEVIFISPRALFTPGNVQLKEEREKTVFAVKIRLDNKEQKLKPGMSGDAMIVTAP